MQGAAKQTSRAGQSQATDIDYFSLSDKQVATAKAEHYKESLTRPL